MPYKNIEKRKAYQKKYTVEYYKKNHEKINAYQRKWAKEHNFSSYVVARNRLPGNREKHLARMKIYYQVKIGKMKKGNCEYANCSNPVEAHHEDYSKPLEVRWVCKKHHELIHHPRIN